MKLAAPLLGLAIALLGSSAAALTQANGTPIPTKPGCNGGKPTGLAAVFSCICKQPNVCNIGAACPGNMDPKSCDKGTNGECESTMWHEWNDDSCVPTNVSGLDPYTEAAVVPETFHPTCPQTFTVRSRGTAIFGDIFGWYNVTGAAPKPDDLHVQGRAVLEWPERLRWQRLGRLRELRRQRHGQLRPGNRRCRRQRPERQPRRRDRRPKQRQSRLRVPHGRRGRADSGRRHARPRGPGPGRSATSQLPLPAPGRMPPLMTSPTTSISEC